MKPRAIAIALANHVNLRQLGGTLENQHLVAQLSQTACGTIVALLPGVHGDGSGPVRAAPQTAAPWCTTGSRFPPVGVQFRPRWFRRRVTNKRPVGFQPGRSPPQMPRQLLNRGTYREERSWKSQQNLPPPHPWLPRAHGHQERPGRAQSPPRQGSPAHDGLDEVTASLPGSRGSAPASGPSAPVTPHHPTEPLGTLRRCDRLQHKADFDAVFQRGRRAHGPHLHVIACPVRQMGTPPRLGLAVAKGVGHAPARARLRRLAREAFRALRPQLQRSVDLVVSARQPWPDARLADVVEELTWLGRKLRLMP